MLYCPQCNKTWSDTTDVSTCDCGYEIDNMTNTLISSAAESPEVKPTLQPHNPPCIICGAPATEWLLFKSQYKQSTVDFCECHFSECRQIFDRAIIDKLITKMLEQINAYVNSEID